MSLLQKMDTCFLIDGDTHLSIRDPATGEWLIDRDEDNDGLSADTVMDRKQAIFDFGWAPGIRGGCWARGVEKTLAIRCLLGAGRWTSLQRGLGPTRPGLYSPDRPAPATRK